MAQAPGRMADDEAMVGRAASAPEAGGLTGASAEVGADHVAVRHWIARVRVTLKPVVNDPAGLSIAQALHQLGFDGVRSVRTGKYFEIELDAADKASAESAADAMCRKLLANPVVERYTYSVGQARGT